MYHRKTYMHINFQQNWVSQNRAHKFICNLQLEFRKVTPFGHALPHNGHALPHNGHALPHNGHLGRFWDQSAY